MAQIRFGAKRRWTMACLIVCSVVAARAQASILDSTSSAIPSHLTNSSAAVTVVTGESWLDHLHRSFGETSMGKTGRLGPATPVLDEQLSQPSQGPSSTSSNHRVTLHGSDLYRLNCQGCHGEAGLGAPPEIGSVINPVRATSATLVMERMKKVGMDVSRAEARQLASQSMAALLKRLRTGGQDMPAFPQLSEAEIRSLIAYLKQLADLPGSAKEQLAVRESRVRVGELIAKSTCHTCHSAEGPNPTREQLLQGAIPPLSTLITRTSRLGLVRKVTNGAPVTMGTPPLLCRGRMPVFFYLSADEATDVYQYLTEYKPSAAVTSVAASSGFQTDQPANAQSQNILTASFLPPEEATTSGGSVDLRIVGLVGLFVALLLAGGAMVTVREFKRLSEDNEIRQWEARTARLQVLRKAMVCPIRAPASPGMQSQSEKRTASGRGR